MIKSQLQSSSRNEEQDTKTRLRLWLRLLKLSSGIEGELRKRLRDDHGTTLPRFDVMAALYRYPDGLKMSDLSDHLRVSNGNVTGIIDRLTEEGLALRVAIPGDRRAHLACLTPKGGDVFVDLAKFHENWINDLLQGLSMEEAETVSILLEQALASQERP